MFKGIIAAFFGKPTVASVMAPLTKITEDLEDVSSVAQAQADAAAETLRLASMEVMAASVAQRKLAKLFA